jgi:hypothetical protein
LFSLTESGSFDQTWFVQNWVQSLWSFKFVGSNLLISDQFSANIGEISISEILQVSLNLSHISTESRVQFSSVDYSSLEILESSQFFVLAVSSLGWWSLLEPFVVSDEFGIDGLSSSWLVEFTQIFDNVSELRLWVVQRFSQFGSWLKSELFSLGLKLGCCACTIVHLLELIVQLLHGIILFPWLIL